MNFSISAMKRTVCNGGVYIQEVTASRNSTVIELQTTYL